MRKSLIPWRISIKTSGAFAILQQYIQKFILKKLHFLLVLFLILIDNVEQ